MWRRISLSMVSLSLTACAAATSANANAPFAGAGRDVITAAEIVAARVTDVYQAVSQLRPEFLKRRSLLAVPTPFPGSVMVYLDDVPFGTAEALKLIPLERVRLIRYIDRMDAHL